MQLQFYIALRNDKLSSIAGYNVARCLYLSVAKKPPDINR